MFGQDLAKALSQDLAKLLSQDLVKQDLVEQDLVEQILVKARRFQDTFKKEQSKQSTHSSKYASLIDKFVPHAETYEDFSPWIYLDSPGAYLTIGYGHLMYKRPLKMGSSLEIQRIKLPSSMLGDIKWPYDIFKDVTVTSSEIRGLYDNERICLGLLDALSMDFVWGHLDFDGKMPKLRKTSPIRKSLRDTVIVSYYSKIVAMSLLLNMRAKKRVKTWSNLFPYWAFAMLDKEHAIERLPVITKAYAMQLLKKNVLKKIYELTLPIFSDTPSFPDFPSYPEDAQLALLDLAYNTGVYTLVSDKKFYSLVTSNNWKALSELKHYPKRSDRAFDKRNAMVKNWFENAEHSTKL